MFGLSKEKKLDFLIGCELQQIALGRFQMILHFSRNSEISIESRADLKPRPNPSAASVWEPERFSDLPEFGKLVGASITSYEIPGGGKLILHFDNVAVLTIHDSNVGHESYQTIGGGLTVVV